MISRISSLFWGACLVFASGCNLEHHAPLRSAELPPLAPTVLHANRLWIDVAERMPENACVAPNDARLLCFERLRTTLGSALTRSLWTSFPGVEVARSTKSVTAGDYVLHIDLDLEALPPDANGPGWSAGARGNWRIRPVNAGLDLRLRGCPVLRQKRVNLIGGGRVEARQHIS